MNLRHFGLAVIAGLGLLISAESLVAESANRLLTIYCPVGSDVWIDNQWTKTDGPVRQYRLLHAPGQSVWIEISGSVGAIRRRVVTNPVIEHGVYNYEVHFAQLVRQQPVADSSSAGTVSRSASTKVDHLSRLSDVLREQRETVAILKKRILDLEEQERRESDEVYRVERRETPKLEPLTDATNALSAATGTRFARQGLLDQSVQAVRDLEVTEKFQQQRLALHPAEDATNIFINDLKGTLAELSAARLRVEQRRLAVAESDQAVQRAQAEVDRIKKHNYDFSSGYATRRWNRETDAARTRVNQIGSELKDARESLKRENENLKNVEKDVAKTLRDAIERSLRD